jgi:hypothetical protein
MNKNLFINHVYYAAPRCEHITECEKAGEERERDEKKVFFGCERRETKNALKLLVVGEAGNFFLLFAMCCIYFVVSICIIIYIFLSFLSLGSRFLLFLLLASSSFFVCLSRSFSRVSLEGMHKHTHAHSSEWGGKTITGKEKLENKWQ